jgi:hypothetical protein
MHEYRSGLFTVHCLEIFVKRITGVECPVCKKRMFSFHVHDYKLCGCPNNTMVDGGREYLRYGWTEKGKKPRVIRWCKRDGIYPDSTVKTPWPY